MNSVITLKPYPCDALASTDYLDRLFDRYRSIDNIVARRKLQYAAMIDRGLYRLCIAGSAVAGRTEVYMDSGVRRGTDVLKALALGARAVLIGRPYTWALAADGEAGVRRVLEMFREEFQNAMTTSGCANVSEVNKSLLHIG